MAKTSSLSAKAAEEILGMIQTERRFRPGDKLPNELELSQELGVSRITLREAIRVLCTQGILEIRRGKGTFVISDDPVLAGPGEPALDLSEAGPRDILELRLAIEPMAAGHAAKRASDETIQRLGGILSKLEETYRKKQPLWKSESSFRAAVVRSGGNTLSEQIEDLLPSDEFLFPSPAPEDYPDRVMEDCRELYRYLKGRNGEGARTVVRGHILYLFRQAGLDIE